MPEPRPDQRVYHPSKGPGLVVRSMHYDFSGASLPEPLWYVDYDGGICGWYPAAQVGTPLCRECGAVIGDDSQHERFHRTDPNADAESPDQIGQGQ